MPRGPWFLLIAACGRDDDPEPTDASPAETGTAPWTDTAPEPTPAACLEETLEGPFPLTVEGSTSGAGDDATGSCGGNGAEDVIYAFAPPAGGRFRIETSGSTDTLLYVRLDCDGEELACNDDARPGFWGDSAVRVDVPAGRTAAVVVDGYDRGGPFSLTVTELPSVEVTCDDRGDEDLDGWVDCLDPDCATVGTCVPECPDHEVAALPATVRGSTALRPDEHDFCGASAITADESTTFVAPAAGTYAATVWSAGLGAVVSLQDGCDGEDLACSQGSTSGTVSAEARAGQELVVQVDTFSAGGSSYEVSIFEVGPEDCANATDDDVDGLPDCLDDACAADPGCDEGCPERPLFGALPIVVTGTTWGRADDHDGACGGGGSDATWAFRAPADGRYTFDTEGSLFDTVLTVLDGCDGAELDCDDDVVGASTSEVGVDLVEGQIVVVVLDGYEDGAGGPFQLRVQ